MEAIGCLLKRSPKYKLLLTKIPLETSGKVWYNSLALKTVGRWKSEYRSGYRKAGFPLYGRVKRRMCTSLRRQKARKLKGNFIENRVEQLMRGRSDAFAAACGKAC